MSDTINMGAGVNFHQGFMGVENVPLEYFKYNVIISGSTYDERNAILSHVLNQLYAKTSDIGVLLIKVNPDNNTSLYHIDKTYKFGDPNLEIPYYIEHKRHEINREQFEYIINAIFGLHPEMRIVIGCVLLQYKAGGFPSSIVDFLEDVIQFLREHPYAEDFNQSNIKSIERAIDCFREDPNLERTLWIPLSLPEWLKLWSEGNTVCIDISGCSVLYKQMLAAFILQVLKNHIPLQHSKMPVGIVAIDDIDQVYKIPPFEEYRRTYARHSSYWNYKRERNYFLTKEQIEQAYGDKRYLSKVQFYGYYSRIFQDELRCRNIALIAVCESFAKRLELYDPIFQLKVLLD